MKWLRIGLAVLIVLLGGLALYGHFIANPRVAQEIRSDPDGTRARETMLLTLPSGRELPVNYLQEGDLVFVGADGPWWRDVRDGGQVTMLIRGRKLSGNARVILDDPAHTRDVFARLRPTAPSWLPDWLNGRLIEIEVIDAAVSPERASEAERG